MKIVADSQIPYLENYFTPFHNVHLVPGREITADIVRDATLLLVRSITPINEKLLAGSSVRFIGSMTTGIDHLDTNWLKKADIPWGAATAFNAIPVAEYVVSAIAALQYYHRLLTVRPAKVAVVGVGNIGKLVVKRLRILGFNVILCDPFRSMNEGPFHFKPLDEIEDVDAVTLHVPLTKTGRFPTFHLINKEFLQRQKPGCVLINTSRGGVIDSEDLLEYGHHLHWCLDVWEDEPNIHASILKRALIATPHIAGYSIQSKIRGIDMLYRKASKRKDVFLNHKKLPPTIPHQRLTFKKDELVWQEVVLQIFNPLDLTTMMQKLLLSAIAAGPLFDELRHDFDSRFEFGYTMLRNPMLEDEDRDILQGLDIGIFNTESLLDPLPSEERN